MGKKIKIFLSNAMGLLFHKYFDDPDKCAQEVYDAFKAGEKFEFEDTCIDRTCESREFRIKFFTALMNLIKGQNM